MTRPILFVHKIYHFCALIPSTYIQDNPFLQTSRQKERLEAKKVEQYFLKQPQASYGVEKRGGGLVWNRAFYSNVYRLVRLVFLTQTFKNGQLCRDVTYGSAEDMAAWYFGMFRFLFVYLHPLVNAGRCQIYETVQMLDKWAPSVGYIFYFGRLFFRDSGKK